MNKTREPWRSLAHVIGLVLFVYGVAALLADAPRPPVRPTGWQHYLSLVLSDGFLFALAGIALALPDVRSPRLRYVRAAIGVLVIALPVLAAIITLLSSSWAASLLSGMRFDTALAFVPAGLVLAALPLEKTTTVAGLMQILSLVVASLGLLGIAGNLLRIDIFYEWYGQAEGRMLSAPAVTLLGVAMCVLVYDAEWRRHVYAGKDDLKITLISAAILIFIALSAGILGFGILVRQSEDVLKNGLVASLHNRIDLFQHIVRRGVDDAALVAHVSDVKALLSGRVGGDETGEIGHVIHAIAKTANMSAIVVYDKDGRRIAQHGRLIDEVELRVRLPVDGRMSLLWARGRALLESRMDLFDRGARVGVAVTIQPLPGLDRLLGDYTGLGRSGTPFVCAPHGTTDVQCFPSRANSMPIIVPRFVDDVPTPVVRALNGEAGLMSTIDYRNKGTLAAYGPIGDLGLGMAVKIDKAELYQPLRRQFEAVLALLFVLVFTGVMLLRWQITPLVRKLMGEIRERRWAEGELRKLSLAVEQSASMVVITDKDGVIEYVNQKFVNVTGYLRSEVVGKTPRILQGGHTPSEEYRRLWGTISTGSEWRGEFRNRKKSGELFWVYEAISPIRNEEGVITHYLAVEEDVTARKQAEDRLSYLAHFDGLTNLPNRALFCDRLKQAMIEATEHKRLVALLFLDLDGFKVINDTLGHEVGDRLLKEVADSLTKCVRRGDTVARLGGDEFTTILADMAHVDDATVVAQKILQTFSRPFSIDDKELVVTASIGITLYPFDDENLDDLIKNADIAMYRAKEHGGNNYQFYTRQMNAKAMDRLAFEISLRRALGRDEFCLYYQPVIDLHTSAVVGAEALVHWRHPQLGLVPLAQFLSLAEEIGLIVPIGIWAWGNVCTQARAWQDEGLGPLRITLNLSACQLQQTNLVETVRQAIAAADLEPDRLGLELTESIFMRNDEATVGALNELHGMGVDLAIDDFGTSYSSPSCLRRFHINTLKIDRSFVQHVGDADNAAIINAIVLMAHSLGIRTVAEGVETEEQIAFLRGCGCSAAQGSYLSKPVPADEFARLACGADRPLAVSDGG